MAKTDPNKLADLVNNLENNVVADPEALQNVVEDFSSVINQNADEKVNKSGDTIDGLSVDGLLEIIGTGLDIRNQATLQNKFLRIFQRSATDDVFLRWLNLDGSTLQNLMSMLPSGDINVFGKIMSNSNEVWHAGNLPSEAGLWTPQIVTTGAAPTVTYTDRNGYYTRTGSIVKCNFFITCTITGGGGFIEISGLPFSPSNFREVGVISRGVIGATPLSWAALGNVGTVNRLRVYDYQNELVQIGVINNGQVFGLTGSITYQI